MVNTPGYVDYSTSLRAFNRRITLNGESFRTKAQWMSWISVNLSSTTFSSVAEFESKLNELSNKLGAVMTANAEFFSLAQQMDSHQFIQVMPIKSVTPQYPVQTNSCLDGCISLYEAAVDAAHNNYHQKYNSHASTPSSFSEAVWNALGLTAAQDDLDELINETLPRQFNDCVSGC